MITYVAALTDDIVTTVSPLGSVAATMEAYCRSGGVKEVIECWYIKNAQQSMAR